MAGKRRQFTREFKLEAVRLISSGERKAEDLARDLGVRVSILRDWQKQVEGRAGLTKDEVFPGNGKQRWSEGRIAELERKIGQQALELDFLKGCLQRIEEQRMLQALTGKPPCTKRFKTK